MNRNPPIPPKGKAPKGAGQGRPKGSKNTATIEREQFHKAVVKRAKEGGISPLEYMLGIMRMPEPKEPVGLTEEGQVVYERRLKEHRLMCMDAAKAAAPYVHPRLAAIDHTHTGNVTISHEAALAELE